MKNALASVLAALDISLRLRVLVSVAEETLLAIGHCGLPRVGIQVHLAPSCHHHLIVIQVLTRADAAVAVTKD